MSDHKAPVVLLVDDSSQDIALIREACVDAGCAAELRALESGRQAMDYLEGRPPFQKRAEPALILLDLQMPEVSGFDVLAWVRQRKEEWHRLPVVVLTTSHDPVDIRKAYDLGANSFLVKPTGFEELSAAMKQVMSYWLGPNRAA